MTDLALDGALGFDPLFKAFYVDELDTSRAFARGCDSVLEVDLRARVSWRVDSLKADATLEGPIQVLVLNAGKRHPLKWVATQSLDLVGWKLHTLAYLRRVLTHGA